MAGNVHFRGVIRLISFGVTIAVIAGCSSGVVDDGAASSSTDNNSAVIVSGPNDSGSQANHVTPVRLASPFDEYRNLLWDADLDQEGQLRRFEAQLRRSEELVAKCMHALGFEYLPDLGSAALEFPDSDLWRPEDIDWVEQWGYGWAAAPTITRGGGQPVQVFGMSDDGGPNAPMLAELSQSERDAWWNALWGPPPPGETFNCFSWGRNQKQNERSVAATEEFAPLMEAISQMEQLIYFEQSEADRLWASCMFDAGYPDFVRQQDASDMILAELTEIQTAHAINPNAAPGAITVANSETMAALQDREISLALADLSCRVSTNFAAHREAHRVAIETQFVDDHRAALTALRDAAEQRGG